MEPLLIHDSTAKALWGVSIGIFVLSALPQIARTRGSWLAASDRGTGRLWFLSWAIGIWLAYQAGKHVRGLSLSGGGWWPVIAGLVLFWAGTALRWWAVATLGRFFKLAVVVEPRQPVIDSGPYRWVRHPAYAGSMLHLIGIGIAFDNVLSIVACLTIPMLGVLRRIKVEEDELRRSLGRRYRDYAARRPRLIPGVW